MSGIRLRPIIPGFFAIGLTLAVAGLARADNPEDQARDFLVQATEAATSDGSGCDVAFLEEYIGIIASNLPDEAPEIYSRTLKLLKARSEKECLRDSLKGLGADPGQS